MWNERVYKKLFVVQLESEQISYVKSENDKIKLLPFIEIWNCFEILKANMLRSLEHTAY